MERGRAPYRYVNGRRRDAWTLSPDRLFLDIAASHLDLHRPKGALKITKEDVEIRLDFDLAATALAGRVPAAEAVAIIAPVILVICAVGAYTVHSSMFDVWLMLVFGVMGYVFKKLNYPLAPLVLALVLGDMAENAFRQSLLGSGGSLLIFVSNPLVGSITALSMVMLFWPFISQLLANMRKRGKVGDDDDLDEV